MISNRSRVGGVQKPNRNTRIRLLIYLYTWYKVPGRLLYMYRECGKYCMVPTFVVRLLAWDFHTLIDPAEALPLCASLETHLLGHRSERLERRGPDAHFRGTGHRPCTVPESARNQNRKHGRREQGSACDTVGCGACTAREGELSS